MQALCAFKASVEVTVGDVCVQATLGAFPYAKCLDLTKLDCAPTNTNKAAYAKMANSVSTFSAFPRSIHADSRDSTEPNVP